MVIRNSFRGRRALTGWLLGFSALAGSASCASGTDPEDLGGNGGEADSSGGQKSSGGRTGSGGNKPASGGAVNSGGSSPATGGSAGGPGGAPNETGGSGPGTGGVESGVGGASEPSLYVSSPDDLTDESEVDYADNEHGIITGGRLKRWLANWKGQRPAAIEGRLIILQIVPSNVGSTVNIPSDEENGIYTYTVGADNFSLKRDNGYTAFETDIPDGASADNKIFKRFSIDPRKDLIVLSFEQFSNTQNTIVHSIGRAWLFFKYWGIDAEHLAILNGSLNWNAATYGFSLASYASHTFSDPPGDGTVSVRDLGVDNTALVIPLEEIIAILDERRDAPSVEDGVRIVDARGGAEALGLAKATSTGQTTCSSYTGTGTNAKCSTPVEGRIKGAKSVPWSQFLDTAPNGFRFLPKLTVKAAFDAQSGWNETSDLTIQYCRTNQRSTVTGIVANTILGYPTRLYETSFIEWGYSSAGPDPDGLGGAGNAGEAPNKQVVPGDFPFRTDLEHLTEHAVLHVNDAAAYVPGGTLGALTQPVTWVAGPNYNAEADVPPQTETWPPVNREATTTRLTIDEDRAYLRDITVDELSD